MEAVVTVINPSRVLMLVQNVHFLPMGPWGTTPCSPGLIHAWSRLGGAIAVSEFVGGYLTQHGGLTPDKLMVVSPAAWGCFGQPPFPNFGALVHQQMTNGPAQGSHVGTAHPSSSCSSSGSVPVIAMLKITPEKGADVFLQLAEALPNYQFVGVCGDPSITTKGLPNVTLLPPQDNIDDILSRVWVVIVPSLWQVRPV